MDISGYYTKLLNTYIMLLNTTQKFRLSHKTTKFVRYP